jgi:PadR family transcriptional regulator, regulatory protein PadR
MARRKRAKTPNLHLSPLEEDLLTICSGDREMYSVEFERVLKEQCDRTEDFGSIYPTLRNLVKRGFLSARWGEETPDQPGGPRRRYYTITDLGKKALEAMEDRRKKLKAWAEGLLLAPEGG